MACSAARPRAPHARSGRRTHHAARVRDVLPIAAHRALLLLRHRPCSASLASVLTCPVVVPKTKVAVTRVGGHGPGVRSSSLLQPFSTVPGRTCRGRRPAVLDSMAHGPEGGKGKMDRCYVWLVRRWRVCAWLPPRILVPKGQGPLPPRSASAPLLLSLSAPHPHPPRHGQQAQKLDDKVEEEEGRSAIGRQGRVGWWGGRQDPAQESGASSRENARGQLQVWQHQGVRVCAHAYGACPRRRISGCIRTKTL